MSNSKKDTVLNSGKGSTGTRKLLIAASALILLSSLATFLILKSGIRKVATAEENGGWVTFPVSDFNDGQARYYSYDYQGKDINFFLLKSSDGVVRAAFDACDVCYASRKGYRQEGDFMICNNCGQRFASLRINEEKGGCNPSPLNRKLEGDLVVIAKSDLILGAGYF